ncbi:MAG: hypothetical protein ABIY51_15980 [Ferruginibacter sp.]
MSETILEQNLLELSRQNMKAYFKTHDVQYVTEDAVFRNMGTGEETIGREAIRQRIAGKSWWPVYIKIFRHAEKNMDKFAATFRVTVALTYA